MAKLRRSRFKQPSYLTTAFLICLEVVLLSTLSNCTTFFLHWNTKNEIFRTAIIDANKGSKYSKVKIICPVYKRGTDDNEIEKYFIYSVSEVEYETCHITNENPRIIAICDQPTKKKSFTIIFRKLAPQADQYYFISTSSKDDLYNLVGGSCSTDNMRLSFKKPWESEEQNIAALSANTQRPSNCALFIMAVAFVIKFIDLAVLVGVNG